MLTASRRLGDLMVCVCLTCGTTLSVPQEALIAMRKRLAEVGGA